MSPLDFRNAPEPELRPVTTYVVKAHRGRQHRKVGICPTEEAAEQWAATERAALRGWQVEVVPVTEPRWVSGDAELQETPAGPGR